MKELEGLLARFSAPGVPAMGPDEIPAEPPFREKLRTFAPGYFPGEGLARYPMLYIGEGYNTIFLIDRGRVIWTYSTGAGWEYDDIWMLSNGNILFSRMGWAAEVTPEKQTVWRMDAGLREELHTVQPIGRDHVLMAVNAEHPRCVIVNKRTGETEYEHAIPYPGDAACNIHGQFRRFRMTAEGNFLVPYLSLDQVVEYDRDFREIWRYDIRSPWAAVRLRNGNTLITDEQDQLTREVDPNGGTVWEFRLSEAPEAYRLADCQSCVRLRNGNTVFCSRGDDGRSPQLLEITREKEVVWAVYAWDTLGPATAVQILNDGGIPENPGDCER